MDLCRPHSSQRVTVAWHQDDQRLHFSEECIETKTVTTTTTTKRSYPPLFVREPRQLHVLDSKEYPLASRPTPPELRQLTFSVDPEGTSGLLQDDLDTQIRRLPSVDSTSNHVKTEPGAEIPLSNDAVASSPEQSRDLSRSHRSRRSATRGVSPSCHATISKGSQRVTRQADKLRRAVARGSTRRDADQNSGQASTDYLATPEATTTGMNRLTRLRHMHLDGADTQSTTISTVYDAASPVTSEPNTILFNSSNVATPPITDADLEPFVDVDESFASLQQDTEAFPPRQSINTVATQDASLPSPRLSPTLAAARIHTSQALEAGEDEDDSLFAGQLTRPDRRRWFEESQTLDYTDEMAASFDSALTQPKQPLPENHMDPRSMLESFDAMPSEMKSWVMFQFLRRCPRKTLHLVADTVNPALKCDFIGQLPIELSLHVLSYLDHRDLCRAAQVSKHWRNIVDSNETGWKELFDRDGLELPPGELQSAIMQGWGWQDPVGPDGCEVDLSLQNRLTSTESELTRSVLKQEKPETTFKTRAPKRKRGPNNMNADRAKRRASTQDVARADRSSPVAKTHKSEGPISAANDAAVVVPDPQIGLPSLRKLHLFKSLYRRHHMIRQSWTSGKVKPGHVAFAAHPRHVITCLQFDDDKIITGSDDTLIHVYDTKTGKLRTKLEGHEGGVWALQYEGNILVSGSTDRSVRVWDIQKGICTQTFFGHTSTVRCLQILMPSDTGRVQNGRPVMMPPRPLIITGSRDSQLRVWRLPEAGSRRYIQSGPPSNDELCPYFLRILSGHTHSVRAISAHGDILVSGSYDSTVRVWRISTGEQLHVLSGHNQKVYSVVLDHKRNRCISGSMDSLVKIWDLETGACLYTLEGHTLLVGLLDLRDERLVSAAADSTLRIWDPETGRCKNTLMAHTGAITCFQHDGRKVISGSEKTVKMWDINSGECVQDLLTGLSGVWQVKFDGRRCVAAVQRGTLTYIEILDFGAVRDGVPPEELGKRKLLNQAEVDRLLNEDI